MLSVSLRRQVRGSVDADVREIDGRPVVWAESNADDRRGALSSDSSTQLQTAARAALDAHLPLVMVLVRRTVRRAHRRPSRVHRRLLLLLLLSRRQPGVL